MNILNINPQIRHLYDMKEVVFDKEWLQTAPNIDLYYMYRNLSENTEDKAKLTEQDFRYDITVMPFNMLGKEFVKTAGHIHSLVPDTNITYPEIYEVLDGKGLFLIQSLQNNTIKDVYFIQAQKGDKVIVPPNYSHIMINIGPAELKTANMLSENCQNEYEIIKEKNGFCYFGLKKDHQEVEWIKNEKYSDTPEIRITENKPLLDKFGISNEESLYSLINNPIKLDFLKNPQSYSWE
ncbi:MAG: glucose-6-phosphate isomerase family protein [bacterium]